MPIPMPKSTVEAPRAPLARLETCIASKGGRLLAARIMDRDSSITQTALALLWSWKDGREFVSSKAIVSLDETKEPCVFDGHYFWVNPVEPHLSAKAMATAHYQGRK